MPDFYCADCDIHKQYPDLDTALSSFDHAVAIRKGRMCPNNNMERFFWDGVSVALIKFPERYPTGANPRLVPREVLGESLIEKPDETKPKKAKKTA